MLKRPLTALLLFQTTKLVLKLSVRAKVRLPAPISPFPAPIQLHSNRIRPAPRRDRKSTRLNSSHVAISYAVFCLKKKKNQSVGFPFRIAINLTEVAIIAVVEGTPTVLICVSVTLVQTAVPRFTDDVHSG